jgi:putative transposase
MKRLQTYQFQMEPNGEQIREMCQFAGNARKVWNLALDRPQKNHAAGEKFSNVFGMNYWLPVWKAEFPFLQNSLDQTLQQVIADLGHGDKNFFEKRAAPPVFKKNGRSSDSFRFPDGRQFTVDQPNRRIILPKLGWIRCRNSRDILGTAKYQRRMSRKVKFSSNWKKAKAKVQKIHTRIAHARKDFLHKTTTTISQNHALVCIEDLQGRNMSRSAKGTVDAPGNNVRQKSGLNRSILDQGRGEFRRQLAYKMVWSGGTLLAVLQHNTSRICPACGHVSKGNGIIKT